ncbi:MAG: hypothetical protein NZM02_00915 [Patescibacteria group bacterium]|nr:hypothetical protein [Patescibacteria group bacterium]
MKKKSINLIINREDYQKYEDFFLVFKKIVFGLFFLFFIILFYFLIIINSLNKKIELLNLEKISVLKIINENTEKYVKLNYLKTKYFDLKNFLKEDSNSSPYYSLLSNALAESSESAIIKEFNINNKREVDFTIGFSDFLSLRNFFQFIESDVFLKNFENISLKNFLVIGATENEKENYELSFYGKFLPYEKIIKNNNYQPENYENQN